MYWIKWHQGRSDWHALRNRSWLSSTLKLFCTIYPLNIVSILTISWDMCISGLASACWLSHFRLRCTWFILTSLNCLSDNRNQNIEVYLLKFYCYLIFKLMCLCLKFVGHYLGFSSASMVIQHVNQSHFPHWDVYVAAVFSNMLVRSAFLSPFLRCTGCYIICNLRQSRRRAW